MMPIRDVRFGNVAFKQVLNLRDNFCIINDPSFVKHIVIGSKEKVGS